MRGCLVRRLSLRSAGRTSSLLRPTRLAMSSPSDGTQQDDLYIPNLSDGAFVPVVGRFTGDRTDKHDFALIEIEPAAVELLRSRRFLSLADIDLSTDPLPNGWYYIHGYPYVDATRGGSGGEFRAKSYTYGTSLYRGPTTSLQSFVAGEHAVVEVDPNRVADSAGNEGRGAQ